MHHSKRTNFRDVLIGLLLWLPAAIMAAPINDTFDHFTTGFPLSGGHRFVECDACHNAGSFSGTARECSTCHSALMNTGAVVKGGFHIQSSNECNTCHSTLAWDDVRRINHMAVLGNCRSCHMSDVPNNHVNIKAGDDCITCHRTSTWVAMHFNHAANTNGKVCYDCHNGTNATAAPASSHATYPNTCINCHNTHNWRFSHGGKTTDCVSCHDNVIVQGMGGSHWPINGAPCSDCHTTRSWSFRHPSAATCLSCHNGTNASGLPGGHMNTGGADCIDCHRTNNWNFVHPPAAGACDSCHNGTTASGKPGSHVPTTLDCGSCHSTRAWTPASFNHSGPYPNHRFTNLGCNDCHSGSPQTRGNAYDNLTYAPYCLACHESDARREHSVSSKYQDCERCHEHRNSLRSGNWD